MRFPRLLSVAAGVAVVGALVFGAASSAEAAPARPAVPPTTATRSVTPFSEIAEGERKKHEDNTRMLMMAGILFVLCSVAPFAVMKLIPFAEGIDALEGGARFMSSRPMAGVGLTSQGLNIASSARGMGIVGKGGAGAGAGGGGGGAMAIKGKLTGAGGAGGSSGGSGSSGGPGFDGSSAAAGGGGGMEFEGIATPIGGSGGGAVSGPRHPVRNAIIGVMLPPVGAAMLAHKGVKAASRKYKTAPRGGSTP